MAYRLLLPATLDLVPADVDSALQAFGAIPMSERGCAWELPNAGAPGVAPDAARVIVRLLPAKGITQNPEEPAFKIPQGTQRAVEVITPADEPKEGDCRRVHDCATALAQVLGLDILNPYRGSYGANASSYQKRLSDPPERDAQRVRSGSRRTQRRQSDRTRPCKTGVAYVPRLPSNTPAPPADDGPGWFRGIVMRMRGAKRHTLPLPQGCSKKFIEALLRQIRVAVPVANISVNRRRDTIYIDAPHTPLVTRTVAELIRRYGTQVAESTPACA